MTNLDKQLEDIRTYSQWIDIDKKCKKNVELV